MLLGLSVCVTAVVIVFVLHWLLLPIATLCMRRLSHRWIWSIGVLLFPLTYIVVIQRGPLRFPSWKSWATRIATAGVAATALVLLGSSSMINSPELIDLKYSIVELFTTSIEFVDQGAVHVTDKAIISDYSFAPSSFAVAALSIVAGAMQFYGPVIKATLMAVVFGFCSFLTEVVLAAWMVESVATQSLWLDVLHDSRHVFAFHLWYLIMFLTAVGWARFDCRTPDDVSL